MTPTLNHVLVSAADKDESARFLGELLGLDPGTKSPGSPDGRFAVLTAGDTHLDFDDVGGEVPAHHYAFMVEDSGFDAILERVSEAGITYSADPMHRKTNEINHLEGGRGFYFHDLNGHNIEVLTRP